MRHLLMQGTDIALYTRALPVGEPIAMPPGAAGNLAVRTARYGRLPLPPNGIPARLTNYRAFVEDMGRQVRSAALRGKVDGIYAHGLCAWGVRRAQEWGVPLVANPHGMEEFKITDPLKRLAYAPFRSWVAAGCKAADRVVATDYSMQDEVSRLLGVDVAKVVVLPNGVDIEEIKSSVDGQVRSDLVARWPILGGKDGALIGISVGRLEANKGFEHLLQALSLIKAQLKASWRWFFVGGGSLRQSLDELAGRLGLGDNVVFVGKLSDMELHSLFSLCNLFAHPSLYEGSSLVTLEAMAHALPVVASAVGGIPDKLREGETGFLVPPGDEAALAERILWLAKHPQERVTMGERGEQLARGKFSWERVAKLTRELFEELIEEKAACRGQEAAG